MLWDQHRERWTVGSYTVRRVTYCKFRELTAAISAEDMARIGRLNAKRESGATLTQEETDTLAAIASRWPVDDLRGACFVPPVSGSEARRILEDLPRRSSERLEQILDDCITPNIPQEDCADPVVLSLIRTGSIGIDVADMTVGQGYALAAMLTPPEARP